MTFRRLMTFMILAWLMGVAFATFIFLGTYRYDVNFDGTVDVSDVQTVVNEYLGEGALLPEVQCVVQSWDKDGVHVHLTPIPCG